MGKKRKPRGEYIIYIYIIYERKKTVPSRSIPAAARHRVRASRAAAAEEQLPRRRRRRRRERARGRARPGSIDAREMGGPRGDTPPRCRPHRRAPRGTARRGPPSEARAAVIVCLGRRSRRRRRRRDHTAASTTPRITSTVARSLVTSVARTRETIFIITY